jgi:hypothetical protein
MSKMRRVKMRKSEGVEVFWLRVQREETKYKTKETPFVTK